MPPMRRGVYAKEATCRSSFLSCWRRWPAWFLVWRRLWRQSTQTVYSSLPASGVVQVPSVGAEADAFNQFGNEVILTKGGMVKQVSVT